MNNDMKLLIDCGGSGVKIKRYVGGVLRSTHQFKPKTREGFYNRIEEMAKDGNPVAEPRIAGMAISICGEYDYVNEEVKTCWFYPFLIGRLRSDLVKRYRCDNVHIVNDGDAHVLALKQAYAEKGQKLASAINLSLGTSVGCGILDWRGELLHTCQGHNWEVSSWRCETSEENKNLYSALGNEGLERLEEKHGSSDAYIFYGQRLCHFLGRDLVPLFRPRLIGLSGGIAVAHAEEIREGIRRECELKHLCEVGKPLAGVGFHFSSEKDSVYKGLVGLLDQE